MHYGVSFAAERLQILQNVRKIAKENIEQKQSIYKEQFDKSAVPHKFSLNDLDLDCSWSCLSILEQSDTRTSGELFDCIMQASEAGLVYVVMK